MNTSLARRLSRVLMRWVAAVWILCVAGAVVFVHHEINRNFDNELAESAWRLLDVATHNLDVGGSPRPDAPPLVAPPPLEGSEDMVYRLADADGHTRLVSGVAADAGFFAAVPLRPGFFNREGWRVYTARHPQRPLLLQLADPRSERRLAVRSVLQGLALPMLAVLALLPLLLGAVARRELRVLHRLEAGIATRGGHDLRPLPLDGMPGELQSAGEHVNRLLDRLSQALDVERALAANAAHELRTPLAAMRLRLQTALEADGPHAMAEVRAALAALDTLRHRTEKLLQLSRAESAGGLSHVPVNLLQLAATVAEECWQLPAARERLSLEVPPAAPPEVPGDVDGLAIALRNLLENALCYSEGRVEFTVRADGVLCVRDHGPGVPPARLQALRVRHVRDSASRAGYGLGLSIVSTIVERHQGRLELLSPPPAGGSGLEARIHLPVVTPAGLSSESSARP